MSRSSPPRGSFATVSSLRRPTSCSHAGYGSLPAATGGPPTELRQLRADCSTGAGGSRASAKGAGRLDRLCAAVTGRLEFAGEPRQPAEHRVRELLAVGRRVGLVERERPLVAKPVEVLASE